MIGTTKYITLEAAQKMTAAAEAEAKANDWNVAIAIVDVATNLLMFQKMDGVQTASIDVSIGKAKTAAGFKRPTKALEDMIAGGRTAFLAVDGVLPVQGGLPIVVDGDVLGAIGVSGLTSAQDEQVAEAALRVLE
jgi:glc operon protein GlcG